MNRIVVITSGNRNAQRILSGLMSEAALQIVGVVLVSGDYSGRGSLAALRAMVRKAAAPYVVAKVLNLAASWRSNRWTKDLKKASIPVLKVRSITKDEPAEFIRQAQADLLVSVSCPQRISSALTSICTFGGINIHASLLPRYAGLAPYYWVLANGEQETGITVHRVVDKFDDGNLLGQRRLRIESGETAFNLFDRLSALGADLLVESAHAALEGTSGIEQDRSNRTYFSHPSWESYRKLHRNGHAIVRLRELLRTALSDKSPNSREVTSWSP